MLCQKNTSFAWSRLHSFAFPGHKDYLMALMQRLNAVTVSEWFVCLVSSFIIDMTEV